VSVRRLALVPLTFIGITLCTFLLVHLAPGDPATLRAGNARGATAESIAALRQDYGLDQPLGHRYLAWLGRSARLDFGRSFTDGRLVRDKIAEALPTTLALALLALALAYGAAVPLGCWLAVADGGRAARGVGAALALGYALPTAAVALWLISVGAPLGGLFAPAACLALVAGVKIARTQRAALLAVLRADYLQTARAKGAGPLALYGRHALGNALLPTLTLIGAELPSLLSGSVVVEQVFGVHGLGLCAFDAVLARDYPTLLGLTSLGALVTLATVLVVDVVYGLVDPRLRGRSA
jgi:peptide/nickel transport system permease protein